MELRMSLNVDSTADVLRAHKNVRCLKGSEGVTAYVGIRNAACLRFCFVVGHQCLDFLTQL